MKDVCRNRAATGMPALCRQYQDAEDVRRIGYVAGTPACQRLPHASGWGGDCSDGMMSRNGQFAARKVHAVTGP